MKAKLVLAFLTIILTGSLVIFSKHNLIFAQTPKTIVMDCLGDIAINNSYAYLTSGCYNEIVVVDLTDPSRPRAISALDIGFWPTRIRSYGSTVLAYDGNPSFNSTQVAVINATDPTNPRKVSSLNLAITNLVFKGRYAYAVDANSPNYLKIIDLIDPTNPITVNEKLVEDDFMEIEQLNNNLFIGGGKLSIYDISNPTEPQLLSQSLGYSYATVLKAEQRYLYYNFSEGTMGGVENTDISNLAMPYRLSAITVNDFFASAFVVKDNKIYAVERPVFDTPNNFRIFEYFPETNTWRSWGSLTLSITASIGLLGNYAYVTTDKGLAVIDIADSANPQVVYLLGTSEPVFWKYVDKPQAEKGKRLVYDITYDNGDKVIKNVQIGDSIPSGTSYVVGSAILDGRAMTDRQDADEFFYDDVNKKVTWIIPSMVPYASGYVTFEVTVQ